MLWFAVFLCSFLTASGQGGRTPRSPCPGVFEYVLTDDGYEGRVTAPAPELQGTLTLVVKLFTTQIQPNRGRLSLLGDVEDGVLFRLELPSQDPLSTVDEISANGVNICTGPRVRAQSLQRSSYTFTLKNFHPSNTRPIERPPTLSTSRRPTSRPVTPSSADATVEDCGIAEVDLHQPLVAFGMPTDKGEWPWLAAIFIYEVNELLCGGSLLDLRHVITAAHCVQNQRGKLTKGEEIYVIMGKYNLKTINEPGNQIKDISQIRVHPSYDYVKFSDDIALLTLESAVTYTQFVRPICLWRNDFPESKLIRQEAAVVGWGRDQNGNMNTARPEMAKAPIVSRQTCQESEKALETITNDRTLCAGYRNGTGPCTGDSGGGLMISNTENNGAIVRYYLQGVVSLALRKRGDRKNCDLFHYAVYTNVNKYLNWLRQFVVEKYDKNTR